jgi:histidinol-phosphate aminotransferase
VRTELLTSDNYVPGPDDFEIRLHANELPWSPEGYDLIDLNVYPDQHALLQLQEQMANCYQVENDQIILTRGSDDGIDRLMRLFITAGRDAIMQFPPTFPMYAFYARLQQTELIQCPLDPENFTLSKSSILTCWQPNCKILMFCSPNNPTGNLMDLDLIASVCEQYANQSIIVVDEAYIEFANAKSAVTLIPKFENLIVLRTLSKAYGMAGLRLGSILAQSHVIKAFHQTMAPFTISSTSIEIAKRVLNHSDWFSSAIKRIQMARNWLIQELKKLPIIEKIHTTAANFILIKSAYAKPLTSVLAEASISVRDFPNNSQLSNYLRLTVGTEEQNQLLIKVLHAFNQKNFCV